MILNCPGATRRSLRWKLRAQLRSGVQIVHGVMEYFRSRAAAPRATFQSTSSHASVSAVHALLAHIRQDEFACQTFGTELRKVHSDVDSTVAWTVRVMQTAIGDTVESLDAHGTTAGFVAEACDTARQSGGGPRPHKVRSANQSRGAGMSTRDQRRTRGGGSAAGTSDCSAPKGAMTLETIERARASPDALDGVDAMSDSATMIYEFLCDYLCTRSTNSLTSLDLDHLTDTFLACRLHSIGCLLLLQVPTTQSMLLQKCRYVERWLEHISHPLQQAMQMVQASRAGPIVPESAGNSHRAAYHVAPESFEQLWESRPFSLSQVCSVYCTMQQSLSILNVAFDVNFLPARFVQMCKHILRQKQACISHASSPCARRTYTYHCLMEFLHASLRYN